MSCIREGGVLGDDPALLRGGTDEYGNLRKLAASRWLGAVARARHISARRQPTGVTDIDLTSYGEPNDIGPDDPAPREPEGEPHEATDRFRVWQFEPEADATVPDTYVVDRNPLPLDFRMWVFVGRGDRSHFAMRASHKYGESEVVPGSREDCCEVLFEGQSLRAEHCPDGVEDLVEQLTGAPVVMPPEPEPETDDSDHGGPINY